MKWNLMLSEQGKFTAASRFSLKVKVKSLSCLQLFATPWTVACTRLLHPWDFLGKSTGVGCHFLLQGIFPTQGSNPGLPHCRQKFYHLSHQGRMPQFCIFIEWFHHWEWIVTYMWFLLVSLVLSSRYWSSKYSDNSWHYSLSELLSTVLSFGHLLATLQGHI